MGMGAGVGIGMILAPARGQRSGPIFPRVCIPVVQLPSVSWSYSIFGMGYPWSLPKCCDNSLTAERNQKRCFLSLAQLGSAFVLIGGGYALDDFRDPAGSVVAWARQLVHVGRVYPYPVGPRTRGVRHQSSQWAP